MVTAETSCIETIWARILSFLGRYALLIAVVLLALYLLNQEATQVALGTIYQLVLIECVAIVLCSLAVIVFTKINFVKEGNYHVLSYVFLGVHILIGLSVVGIYFVQWAQSAPGS